MHLFLMRHGNAGAFTVPDSARELTALGRDEVSRVITHVLADGYTVKSIASSSYVRAIQSAQIVAAKCNTPGQFSRYDAFTPDTPPEEALKQLEIIYTENLLVTLHQPLISRLVGLLAHGDSAQSYPLQTAACVCLEVDVIAPGCSEIKWIKDPSQCK